VADGVAFVCAYRHRIDKYLSLNKLTSIVDRSSMMMTTNTLGVSQVGKPSLLVVAVEQLEIIDMRSCRWQARPFCWRAKSGADVDEFAHPKHLACFVGKTKFSSCVDHGR